MFVYITCPCGQNGTAGQRIAFFILNTTHQLCNQRKSVKGVSEKEISSGNQKLPEYNYQLRTETFFVIYYFCIKYIGVKEHFQLTKRTTLLRNRFLLVDSEIIFGRRMINFQRICSYNSLMRIHWKTEENNLYVAFLLFDCNTLECWGSLIVIADYSIISLKISVTPFKMQALMWQQFIIFKFKCYPVSSMMMVT